MKNVQRNNNRGNMHKKKEEVEEQSESQDMQDYKAELTQEAIDEFDDSYLPKKNSFRVDEAARYFDVSERAIRLWIDHGHLTAEKVGIGSIRITRNSILTCRFGRSAAGRMRI